LYLKCAPAKRREKLEGMVQKLVEGTFKGKIERKEKTFKVTFLL